MFYDFHYNMDNWLDLSRYDKTLEFQEPSNTLCTTYMYMYLYDLLILRLPFDYLVIWSTRHCLLVITNVTCNALRTKMQVIN